MVSTKQVQAEEMLKDTVHHGFSNSIKQLKDLYHASNAVRMLITIILTSASFVLLTFLTWLI